MPLLQMQGLQAGGVVNKRVLYSILLRQVAGQGLHAESLGRVVPGVDQVYSQFLGKGVGMVRAFTRDESINSACGCRFNLRSSPAGDDTDVFYP